MAWLGLGICGPTAPHIYAPFIIHMIHFEGQVKWAKLLGAKKVLMLKKFKNKNEGSILRHSAFSFQQTILFLQDKKMFLVVAVCYLRNNDVTN